MSSAFITSHEGNLRLSSLHTWVCAWKWNFHQCAKLDYQPNECCYQSSTMASQTSKVLWYRSWYGTEDINGKPPIGIDIPSKQVTVHNFVAFIISPRQHLQCYEDLIRLSKDCIIKTRYAGSSSNLVSQSMVRLLALQNWYADHHAFSRQVHNTMREFTSRAFTIDIHGVFTFQRILGPRVPQCQPHMQVLNTYWGYVESRLYKICNISSAFTTMGSPLKVWKIKWVQWFV